MPSKHNHRLAPSKWALRAGEAVEFLGAVVGWVLFGDRGKYFALFLTVLLGMFLGELIKIAGGHRPWSREYLQRGRSAKGPIVSGLFLAACALLLVVVTHDLRFLGGVLFFGAGAGYLIWRGLWHRLPGPRFDLRR